MGAANPTPGMGPPMPGMGPGRAARPGVAPVHGGQAGDGAANGAAPAQAPARGAAQIPAKETRAPNAAASQTLVPVTAPAAAEELFRIGPMVERLPVELDVAVPVREFRVRQLLALAPGKLIETQWAPGDDVPLTAGEVRLAWSEFEVIDDLLAVRITRLP